MGSQFVPLARNRCTRPSGSRIVCIAREPDPNRRQQQGITSGGTQRIHIAMPCHATPCQAVPNQPTARDQRPDADPPTSTQRRGAGDLEFQLGGQAQDGAADFLVAMRVADVGIEREIAVKAIAQRQVHQPAHVLSQRQVAGL